MSSAGGAVLDGETDLQPVLPDDSLGFEQLLGRYNFPLQANERHLFTRVVIAECQRRAGPVGVLDIGCGEGINREPRYQRLIRRYADRYFGIEPDDTIEPELGIFDDFHHALLETAPLPPESVDVAYSHWVMEHVADPDAFLAALHRCLKPGGCYIFMTPNARHYFGHASRIMHRLGFEETVLRALWPRRFQAHYAAHYRFNDRDRIRHCALRSGFLEAEIAHVEVANAVRGYMRGPLRPIWHLFRLKRRWIRKPELLAVLFGRLTKPAA